jgi:hypothetical protein
MEPAHATTATTGLKGMSLLAIPTNSHPSSAHDLTGIEFLVELMMIATPRIDSPAIASVRLRAMRTVIGDFAFVFALAGAGSPSIDPTMRRAPTGLNNRALRPWRVIAEE